MQNDDNFDDMEIVHIIVDFNLDSLVVTLHFFLEHKKCRIFESLDLLEKCGASWIFGWFNFPQKMGSLVLVGIGHKNPKEQHNVLKGDWEGKENERRSCMWRP